MEEQTYLNVRQWRLYRYLKSQYKRNEFLSREEICERFSNFYLDNKNLSYNYKLLAIDINKINENNDTTKIIISTKKGYKIGNAEESLEFIKRRFNFTKEILKYNSILLKKYNLNEFKNKNL